MKCSIVTLVACMTVVALPGWGVSAARTQLESVEGPSCSPGPIIAACEAVFASGVQSAESAARALNNSGLAYVRLNILTRAVSDFDEAIRISPRYSEAYRNRGLAFALQGDYARAIVDFDEAVELNPADVRAFQNRALSYQFLGDYMHAVADFDRAIERDSSNAEAFNGRCWARVLWGQALEAALRDCNEALKLRPRDANALNSRAAVAFLRNDFRSAAQDYDLSFRLQPKMIGSLYGRGVSRLRLGQTDLGRADIAEAVLLDVGVAPRYDTFGVRP